MKFICLKTFFSLRNTTTSSLIIGNNSDIILKNSIFSNVNFSSLKNPFVLMGEINSNNIATLIFFQNLTFNNLTCTKGSVNNYLVQSFSRFVKIVCINFAIQNSNFGKSLKFDKILT